MNPDFVPKTILEAVNALYATLTPAGEAMITNNPPEANHFSGGMALRNDWSLWKKETPIKRDAVETYGLAHADDISALIMAWVWAKERREPFDPQAFCKRFHEHWHKQGLTSLQAGGYNNDKTPME